MENFSFQKLIEYSKDPKQFINHQDFFQYHGIILTFIWILATLLAIRLKKTHIALHTLAFIIIDIITLYFVVGAWIRVYPTLHQYQKWTFVKKVHIFGGTLFMLLLIWQHLLGTAVLFYPIKKSKFHVFLGWLVNNLAKIVAYFGWIFGKNKDKKWLAQYVLIVSVIIFVIATGALYKKLKKNQKYKIN